jgi:transcriptional regulator with XRE-family HTH domain
MVHAHSVVGESRRGFHRLVGLREVRRQARLKQHELAQLSGLTRRTMSRLERQRHPARSSTMERLADALHVSSARLIVASPGD